MQFELPTPTPAMLTSVTPRTEIHGDDKVFAISLGLKLTGPNTLLDKLSPTMRTTLYQAVEGQEQLPGVEPATPLLRTRGIEQVNCAGKLEGWTLYVDHGIDEGDPIALGDAKLDKFRVCPKEGGSIELLFRVGTSDIDSEEAGLLCSKLGTEITITLRAPELKVDKPVIDGTVGHAGLAAQRSAEESGQRSLGDPEDETDGDGEGDAPDATDTFVAQHDTAPKRTARGGVRRGAH
jgi:hypothetical protein